MDKVQEKMGKQKKELLTRKETKQTNKDVAYVIYTCVSPSTPVRKWGELIVGVNVESPITGLVISAKDVKLHDILYGENGQQVLVCEHPATSTEETTSHLYRIVQENRCSYDVTPTHKVYLEWKNNPFITTSVHMNHTTVNLIYVDTASFNTQIISAKLLTANNISFNASEIPSYISSDCDESTFTDMDSAISYLSQQLSSKPDGSYLYHGCRFRIHAHELAKKTDNFLRRCRGIIGPNNVLPVLKNENDGWRFHHMHLHTLNNILYPSCTFSPSPNDSPSTSSFSNVCAQDCMIYDNNKEEFRAINDQDEVSMMVFSAHPLCSQSIINGADDKTFVNIHQVIRHLPAYISTKITWNPISPSIGASASECDTYPSLNLLLKLGVTCVIACSHEVQSFFHQHCHFNSSHTSDRGVIWKQFTYCKHIFDVIDVSHLCLDWSSNELYAAIMTFSAFMSKKEWNGFIPPFKHIPRATRYAPINSFCNILSVSLSDLQHWVGITVHDFSASDEDQQHLYQLGDGTITSNSGSTGRPKGCELEHHSVVNLIRAERILFDVHSKDRVYQGFSIAFDASVEEVWLAFASGACLVAATPEMLHAGPGLPAMLNEAGITVVSTVPTLLTMMEDTLPNMRILILGGEACHKDLILKWSHNRRMINTYGPTEASVIATHIDCDANAPIVTIGSAVPSYFLYILDGDLNPCPVGVAGELHIGGQCVARGYLNRPELNVQKFIPFPSSKLWIESEGENSLKEIMKKTPRLYKTGDLTRWTEDGQIEFCGRIDAQVGTQFSKHTSMLQVWSCPFLSCPVVSFCCFSQVKLRGFRVELSEIESVLMTQPNVQSAVVSVREDIPGIQNLIGYVILKNKSISLNQDTLKEGIRVRLPPYMIPACIECLEQFPTLPSGKVNRKELPPPKNLKQMDLDLDFEEEEEEEKPKKKKKSSKPHKDKSNVPPSSIPVVSSIPSVPPVIVSDKVSFSSLSALSSSSQSSPLLLILALFKILLFR